MNRNLVDQIADAVLYEGYILYPYRPSVKNRERWTFGGLYPEAYSQTGGGDACANQTECLIEGGADAAVEVVVRFLHLTDRRIGAYDPPLTEWPGDGERSFRPVETLQIGDRHYQSWQEAEEREIALNDLPIAELLDGPRLREFTFPGGRLLEPLHGEGGAAVGVLRASSSRSRGRSKSAPPRFRKGCSG